MASQAHGHWERPWPGEATPTARPLGLRPPVSLESRGPRVRRVPTTRLTFPPRPTGVFKSCTERAWVSHALVHVMYLTSGDAGGLRLGRECTVCHEHCDVQEACPNAFSRGVLYFGILWRSVICNFNTHFKCMVSYVVCPPFGRDFFLKIFWLEYRFIL